MLTKSEIARVLSDDYSVGGINQCKNMLDALADLARTEIEAGNGFTIPGVAKIDWRYTPPRVKGQMYKKGETYVGFGGVEQVAEEDSKARKAAIKLVATPAAPLKRNVPKANDKSAVSRFLSSKVGKAITSRKG